MMLTSVILIPSFDQKIIDFMATHVISFLLERSDPFCNLCYPYSDIDLFLVRFLDILNDAPLAAHRKPTRIYGSIFYCFLLASDFSFM